MPLHHWIPQQSGLPFVIEADEYHMCMQHFNDASRRKQLFLDVGQLIFQEETQVRPLHFRHFLVVLRVTLGAGNTIRTEIITELIPEKSKTVSL